MVKGSYAPLVKYVNYVFMSLTVRNTSANTDIFQKTNITDKVLTNPYFCEQD